MAVSHAMRRLANCHAFWTVLCFAGFVWAKDLAIRFLAFHVAHRVLWLLAGCVTFWRLANGLTDCVATGVVTFP